MNIIIMLIIIITIAITITIIIIIIIIIIITIIITIIISIVIISIVIIFVLIIICILLMVLVANGSFMFRGPILGYGTLIPQHTSLASCISISRSSSLFLPPVFGGACLGMSLSDVLWFVALLFVGSPLGFCRCFMCCVHTSRYSRPRAPRIRFGKAKSDTLLIFH